MFRSFGFGTRSDDVPKPTEESIKKEDVLETKEPETKDEPIPEKTSQLSSEKLDEEAHHMPKKSHSTGHMDSDDGVDQFLNLKEVRDLRRIHSIKRFEDENNISDEQTEHHQEKLDMPEVGNEETMVGNEETLDVAKKVQSDEEEIEKHVVHSKLQDMRKRGNIVDPEAELQLLNSTYENKAKDGSKVIEDLDKPQENNSPVKNVKQVDQVDQVDHDEEKTKEIPSAKKFKCGCVKSKEDPSSNIKCKCGSKQSEVVAKTSICDTIHISMALKCTIGVVLLSIFLGVLCGKRILG